jgi:uncharacterized membrane protein YdjX (TVP38/TMEM64 family)
MTLVYTKNARIRLWITRAAWTAAAVCAWLWKSELFELVERSGEANLAVSLTVYSTAYVVLAGLAVPGAVLLTVVAGSLFGVTIGTIVASFISTLGASLAFLIHQMCKDLRLIPSSNLVTCCQRVGGDPHHS